MHEVNFIDKSFDQGLSGQYSISIQADSNGLSYCISDDESNSYIVFRKHRFEKVVLIGDLIREITAVLKEDDFLNLKFHRVRFLGYTQQSTLVPVEYFDLTKMQDYLSFSQGGDIDLQVFNTRIDETGIHNIFALPEELVNTITHHFKKVEFFNQTTPFIRSVAENKDLSRPAVYAGLNPYFFDIVCSGNGKLKLYNTFQYAGESDLLYYIIFIYNSAGYDHAAVPLILSGEYCSRLTYYEMLKQYLPNISFNEAICNSILSPGLKQLNVSRFLNLLNLKSCASSVEHTEAGK